MLLVEVAVEVGIETSEWTETGLPKSLDEVVAGKLEDRFCHVVSLL